MLASLQGWGSLCCANLLLSMVVIRQTRISGYSSKSQLGMLSGLGDLLRLSLFKAFSTSDSDTCRTSDNLITAGGEEFRG